jgi:DNA-binding NtrC family response regulator
LLLVRELINALHGEQSVDSDAGFLAARHYMRDKSPTGNGNSQLESRERESLTALAAAALSRAGLCPIELQVLEAAAIKNALQHAGGNRTHAARSLGISVRTLQRKLRNGSAGDRLADPSQAHITG